ncbi:MAG: hypothetical protein RR945_03955 [Erysipelotrichaceae bacterium]
MSKRKLVTLMIDKVTKNNDETLAVYFGYKNRGTHTLTLTQDQSYLYVRKGGAIVYPNNPPIEIRPGRHKQCFKTIIMKNTELFWNVRKERIVITYAKANHFYLKSQKLLNQEN